MISAEPEAYPTYRPSSPLPVGAGTDLKTSSGLRGKILAEAKESLAMGEASALFKSLGL